MIHKFKQKDLNIVVDVNSGAVHVVDDIVYECLEYYKELPKDEIVAKLSPMFDETKVNEAFEEIVALEEAGVLYASDAYIDNLDLDKSEPVIKAMCLHVAHDCNLRCAYCFASQGDYESHRSIMDLETGKKALKFLAENSGSRRNLEVDFFGGEPLMNFEVCKELVTYGRALEKEFNKLFRFTMTTNCLLLDDDKIEYINEHMDNVVLSLDGRREVNDKMRFRVDGSGSYDQIIPNIKKMIEKRGRHTYYVRGTFTKFNTDFAKDVLHFADLGFKSTSIEPVVAEPHHNYALDDSDLETVFQQYDELADELIARKGTEKEFDFFHFTVDLSQGPCVVKRIRGCGAGAEYISVTPEGDIYPCHQFVGNEEFKIGHVDSGIEDREMSLRFKKANVLSKEECQSCWAKFYCSGGCHANAYNFNNDIFKPYKLGCEMEKKRLECSLYIQAKTLLENEDA
jgi:uncharacterized protein